MLTREYCLEQAEICEAHAAEAVGARLRNEWLVTARIWRDVAGEPASSAQVVPLSDRVVPLGSLPSKARRRAQ